MAVKIRFCVVAFILFATLPVLAQEGQRPERLQRLDSMANRAFNDPPKFVLAYQDRARTALGAWCGTLVQLLEFHAYRMAGYMVEGAIFVPGTAAKEGHEIVKAMREDCGEINMPQDYK